ncbi:DNA polymerase III, alpha subunit [Dinoroseobacter shibae DFL 12 = DSM 16493]|jgi:DNA polymerase-3 subunit alpha/error-prone DNA polymerase|uniref:Error-prone DNA polymerase n=1 Tax=Dinoroseobacter shibae (strain DSM 16493 / NCIMB 14021 / DFL 12) TaxID=398580 RepID=A8LKK8_DINSH|nr:error-prone DNA polymerase [Dinoroseobacter shibae]ABV91851.1 DNA polymerase III, alpha subunit [Dinoroseobacter shibae DFL 12 = DSM 16493]URF46829.1 error-prone DNA polymerase [Dinoroseobacter shibae]URF51140.1 error-prone DNA polymerase [Dinoroseobacter shibae]
MFVELCALSNFTFLTGASHPEDYAQKAALLGLPAFAIADVNSVAGIVRAHTELKEIARQIDLCATAEARDGPIGPPWPGPRSEDSAAVRNLPRLLPAARLRLREGTEITALPEDRAAWGRLSRLLTLGQRRAPKGRCHLDLADVLDEADGMQLLLHGLPEAPPVQLGAGRTWPQAEALTRRFPGKVSLLMTPAYDGQDRVRFDRWAALADTLGLPTVASAAPLFHCATHRRLADVLTAIRNGCRVEDLGRTAQAHAEQRLRSEAEMLRLFRGHEDAVHRTAEIAARCSFCLSQLRYEYPSETRGGETAQDRLSRLAHEGLRWRYRNGAPPKVRKMLDHELRLIGKLGYAPYFLTVNDIVAFARSRDILCQGRGSAANSVVCYCLGITSVSPEVGTMVFERFVSEARDEPPDIDVDFEHERREEVIQHIYERYGRHRAGLCATVIHYRGKRAVREVGRAMGLSSDTLSALSSQIWGFGSVRGIEETRLREIGLDPTDRRLRQTIDLIYRIQGFPRHLSQHVGGFIITEGRLDELVPVENATMVDRTVVCWDKDDLDSLGILKIDILALGMLSCVRKAFDLIAHHHGAKFSLATLPVEDPAVYDMLCRADSIGVFQVESRAQMNFLPRMRPRCFYDLVIQVAIVRPGPIQGDMVHPFIRRRNGEEQVEFPSDALGEVLSKTLGVPLFQEQAMQIAIVGAGFDPSEADRLRRALATFKKHGNVSEFRTRFLKGMAQNGYDTAFAERCFSQIEGFGSYGFPESHAASFALLVYASAWIKCHHPGIFACALLNAQPMGFYAPAQIMRDAREHGVTVRPVCVNASFWDNTMEPDGQGGLALRLGFRQVKGLAQEDAEWLVSARGNGYGTVADLWRRAGLGQAVLTRLAEADAFAELGLGRRDALWQARAIRGDAPLPLFSGDMDGEGGAEPPVVLPPMSLGEEVVEDFVAMRLSLRAHPVALLRHVLTPGMGDPELAGRVQGPRGAGRSEGPAPRAPRDI